MVGKQNKVQNKECSQERWCEGMWKHRSLLGLSVQKGSCARDGLCSPWNKALPR